MQRAFLAPPSQPGDEPINAAARLKRSPVPPTGKELYILAKYITVIVYTYRWPVPSPRTCLAQPGCSRAWPLRCSPSLQQHLDDGCNCIRSSRRTRTARSFPSLCDVSLDGHQQLSYPETPALQLRECYHSISNVNAVSLDCTARPRKSRHEHPPRRQPARLGLRVCAPRAFIAAWATWAPRPSPNLTYCQLKRRHARGATMAVGR